MIYRRVQAPVSAPVSVADAKARLRVEHHEHDILISELIDAAVDVLDGRDGILGRCLEGQTWEAVSDRFPVGDIEIELGPVVSIESIGYLDENGDPQTVPVDGYTLSSGVFEASVKPSNGWPVTGDGQVVVRYVAGIGTPPLIRQAIKEMVAARYDGGVNGAMLSPEILRDIKPFRRLSL